MMSNLVIMKEHKAVTTSLQVAENFEKDVEKFKADGLTFDGFVELMTHYKICDKYE